MELIKIRISRVEETQDSLRLPKEEGKVEILLYSFEGRMARRMSPWLIESPMPRFSVPAFAVFLHVCMAQ